ncbi:MAG: hypothetical protein WCJ60_02375 [bacterium]
MILLFFAGGGGGSVATPNSYILFRKGKMLINPYAFKSLKTPDPSKLLTGNEYLEI